MANKMKILSMQKSMKMSEPQLDNQIRGHRTLHLCRPRTVEEGLLQSFQLIPPAQRILQPPNTPHWFVHKERSSASSCFVLCVASSILIALPYCSSSCFCHFTWWITRNVWEHVRLAHLVKQKAKKVQCLNLSTATDQFTSGCFLGQICSSLMLFWHCTHGFVCEWW